MPVYIPSLDGYFLHGLEVVRLCLESIYQTTKDSASITVIDNGCVPEVKKLLFQFQMDNKIDQLVINSKNRGKVDAVLSVARSSFEPLITIADADVNFKPGWVDAVMRIFRSFPECGVVSPFPNPVHALRHTSATILGAGLYGLLRIGKLIPDQDLIEHSRGIGSPNFFKPCHFSRHLYLERDGQKALVGAEHFVFTLRREIIETFPKNSANSTLASSADEFWIDAPPDRSGWWRLSTPRSYVYHMGNHPEKTEYMEFAIANNNNEYFIPVHKKNILSSLYFPLRHLIFRVVSRYLYLNLHKISVDALVEEVKLKFLLLFPDGIGLRNFVLTHFLSLLGEKGDVIVWHALPEQAIQMHVADFEGKVRWQALPHHHEGQLPFLFRRAKLLAQLYRQDEPGTDIVLKQTVGKGKGLYRLRNRLAEVLGYVGRQPHSRILWLERFHTRWVERQPYFKEYLTFLEKEKPDVVFCSHQRSEIAVPAMLAARKLGIPTATFIYSWDNLPKGRMAIQADYFLVWSEHMRDEMLHYYPDINEERIFIIGTPQFEHYFKR